MSDNFYKTVLDLDLSQEVVLTPNLAAQLVTQIFKLLLFQRNQIPQVFTTLNYFISKWTSNNNDLSDEFSNHDSFELQRHRLTALNTFNDIKKFCNIIVHTFATKETIKSIRFLFGPTPLMPKEAYTIKIPQLTYNHYDENHKQFFDPIMRNFLRSVLTSDKLSKAFLSPLNPTNVYMDFELEPSISIQNEYLNLKEMCDFHPKCREIIFNIVPAYSHQKKFICCRNLKIFEDIRGMGDPVNEDQINIIEDFKNDFNWYEAKYVIKGFKDNKKFNIWKSE